MKIQVHYKNTKSYGTRNGVRCYGATIGQGRHSCSCIGEEGTLKLAITFPWGGKPMSEAAFCNEDPEPEIKGFDLSLSAEEAVDIATALLTYARHPHLAAQPTRWMPLNVMPALERNDWKKTVSVSCDKNAEKLIITNSSKYHLGGVTVKFTWSVTPNSEKKVFVYGHELDLPPNKIREISLFMLQFSQEIPYCWTSRITIHKTVIKSLTGFDLSTLR